MIVVAIGEPESGGGSSHIPHTKEPEFLVPSVWSDYNDLLLGQEYTTVLVGSQALGSNGAVLLPEGAIGMA